MRPQRKRPKIILPKILPFGRNRAIVVIGGSFAERDAAIKARELGRKLSKLPVKLYVGLPFGVPGEAAKGFIRSKRLARNCSLFFPSMFKLTLKELHQLRKADIKFLEKEMGKMMKKELSEFKFHPQVKFAGLDMTERRVILGSAGHITIALGGGSGTMHEAMVSLNQGKPTILIESHGGSAKDLSQERELKKSYPNLFVAKDVKEAAEIAKKIIYGGYVSGYIPKKKYKS